MIYVDDRAGSKDLLPLLRARSMPCTLTRMDYGDLHFMGIGPGGLPVPVGIEVKSVRDVLSCVCDGRFAGHQLPGLVRSYEQVCLLMVGGWRANARTGMLEYRRKKGSWEMASVGTRTFMARDLMTWLNTMAIKGGIQVVRMSDWDEAVVWVCSLYSWWQGKGWDGHKSHLAFHDGTRHGTPFQRDRATLMAASFSDRALLTRPTLCRMVSAQLPGIGWEKSAGIAKKFKTVERLVQAGPEDMQEIDGIGTKLATGIYQALRSEK